MSVFHLVEEIIMSASCFVMTTTLEDSEAISFVIKLISFLTSFHVNYFFTLMLHSEKERSWNGACLRVLTFVKEMYWH